MSVRSPESRARAQRIRDEARRVDRNFDTCANNFENKMRGLFFVACTRCSRRVERLKVRNNLCTSCQKPGFNPYTRENEMDLGDIPDELKELTMIESILIARVHPVVSVFRIRGQQRAFSGHVMNFIQEINHIATRLPHDPRNLDCIICMDRETPHGLVHFKERSNRVRRALEWLKINNRYYHDIIIDEVMLASLSDDEDLTRNLPVLPDIPPDDVQEENIDANQDNIIDRSCYPNLPTIDVRAAISHNLELRSQQPVEHIDWPPIEPERINEFTTEGLICQAFPVLFPYGRGDLRAPRIQTINNSDYFKYLMDYHDGRFANDMRFPYYAYNSLARWSAINSGNVYVRHHQMADLDAQAVREIIEDEDSDLAASIMYYGASLRGTRA